MGTHLETRRTQRPEEAYNVEQGEANPLQHCDIIQDYQRRFIVRRVIQIRLYAVYHISQTTTPI